MLGSDTTHAAVDKTSIDDAAVASSAAIPITQDMIPPPAADTSPVSGKRRLQDEEEHDGPEQKGVLHDHQQEKENLDTQISSPSAAVKRLKTAAHASDNASSSSSSPANGHDQANYMEDAVVVPPKLQQHAKSQQKAKTPTSASKKKTATLTSFFKKDTSKPAVVTPPPVLSDEAYGLLELERTTMGQDWYKTFLPEMQKEYFLKIKRLLKKEDASATVYPSLDEIYTFTKYPLADIRVVILGQDPYHGPGQAHGLCFSVKKGVTPPPSLVNIYKEIKSEYGDSFQIPKHGFLEEWSKQGVLLLNASLTVRANTAASHSNWGWTTFTDAIIQHISKKSEPGIVFLLWGGHARKKKSLIDGKRHLILESAHPSPLSAYQGFFGNGHFRKANEYLEKHGKRPVEWGKL